MSLTLDETQSLIDRPPGWIVRRGIASILVVVLFVWLSLSWLGFLDNDSSDIAITLNTDPAPCAIVSVKEGSIGESRVKCGQRVNQNDALVVLGNPREFNDVSALKRDMDSLSLIDPIRRFDGKRDFERKYSLGSIQSAYQYFVECHATFQQCRELDSIQRAKLQRGFIMLKEFLLECDFEHRFLLPHQGSEPEGGYRILYSDSGKIRERSDTNAVEALPRQSESPANVEAETIRVWGQELRHLLSEMAAISQGTRDEAYRKCAHLALDKAFNELSREIAGWERDHIVRAPIDGTIAALGKAPLPQVLKPGDTIMVVVPSYLRSVKGIGDLPLSSMKSIEIGQSVLAMFSDSLDSKQDTIGGKVSAVDPLGGEGHCRVIVSFETGMRATNGKMLQIKDGMHVSVKIVTTPTTMLSGFFSQLDIRRRAKP